MENSAARWLQDVARRFPDKVGIEDEKGSFTWAELEDVAVRGASGLLACGVGNNRPVLVYLPKSRESVASFMAALFAGCPYAAVDYAIPLARLEQTVANLRPAAVITGEEGRQRLEGLDLAGAQVLLYGDLAKTDPDRPGVAAALGNVVDTDPIYIMYTSGSTGTPKGVTIAHRGVLDYAPWVVDTFGLTEESVLGMQSGFHFDNCVFDLYGCMMTGAKLVIIPEVLFMYPRELMDFLEEKQVTCIFWVPTVMISVANSGTLEGRTLPHLKTVAFAGEVMPNKQLNVWRRALPQCQFANLYGPTEITDVCCCYVVDRPFADHESLPIGKPCANSRVMLLTEDNRLAAPGEEGEICVAGSCLALGYWNEPELTNRAFVQNPRNPAVPERIYRTGDLGYWNERGELIFCGRRDFQIKLRGNRIELGDIETAASTLPGAEKVCALFDPSAQEILLVIQGRESFSLRRVNLALGQMLPKYMLPRRLEVVEAMPLTASRKIDRVSLKKRFIPKEN